MKGIHKIVKKTITLNKQTTSIILAIILTAIILFTTGLVFSSIKDSLIKNIAYQKGNYHLKLNDLPYEDYLKVTKENIKTTKYSLKDKIIIKDKHKEEIKLNIINADSNFFKEVDINKGTVPINKKEIIIPNIILKKLNLKINDNLNNYKIVGTYNDDYNLCYLIEKEEEDCNNIYLLDNKFDNKDIINFHIYFNKLNSHTFEDIKTIANNLNLKEIKNPFNEIMFTNMDINMDLLSLYGANQDYSTHSVINAILMLVSLVIGIACFFIINNSIAITTTERKKTYGILASIGTSKRQIIKMIFYETFILSIIGITIGFIISLGLINVFINNLNNILGNIILIDITTKIEPLFLLTSLIFIILTIFISALFPALRASEISPIEAIKQRQDLKMKQVKTNKPFKKLFGFTGELARKYQKRNKRNYRLTTISLFISIILFITVSTIINIIIVNIDKALEEERDFDVHIYSTTSDKETNLIYNDFKNLKQVDKINLVVLESFRLEKPLWTSYNINVQKALKTFETTNTTDDYDTENNILIYIFEENNYKDFKNSLNLKEDKPILINYTNIILRTNPNNKEIIEQLYEGEKFKTTEPINITLCTTKRSLKNNKLQEELIDCNYNYNDIFLTKKIPFPLKGLIHDENVLIVKEGMEKNLPISTINDYDDNPFEQSMNIKQKHIYLKTNDYLTINKDIDNIIDKANINYDDVFYENHSLEKHNINQLLLGIKLIMYAIIIFFIIMAITSAFNTISSNINLRKQEFAILRSVGLDKKGFNKIIFFEGLLISTKATIYSLPIVYLILYVLIKIMDLDQNNTFTFYYPTKYITYSIIGTFIIVFIIMKYISKKIQFNNIADELQ